MTLVLDYELTGSSEPIAVTLREESCPSPHADVRVRICDGTPWDGAVAALRRLADELEALGGYLPNLPRHAET